MSRIDFHAPSRLWCEEMNRIRHQIQQRWTQAQRTYRRQLALCRQQELARLLRLVPDTQASQHPITREPADAPARTPAHAFPTSPDAHPAKSRGSKARNP